MTKKGTIHKLMYIVYDCFNKLKITVPPSKLESLVLMLYRSMMRKGRDFHSIKHVFNLVEPKKPLFSLAALFHDQVYYQVDGGFSPDVQKLISTYIKEIDKTKGGTGKIYLKDALPADDQALGLNLMVFGFSLGMELNPFGGLNEFLSSLVMTKSLEQLIPLKDLLKMAVYIEATIPFRGESPFQALAQRVKGAGEKFNFNFPPMEIDEIIKEAVRFANKDVSNFAEEDPREFLDNTWALIPETNMSLRDNDIYTIGEYRVALQKMEGFFSFLNPENVFHQFKGTPSDDEFLSLKERGRKNINTARQYLKIKLFTIAILEALAEATGGDAPIALFMGDLPEKGEKVNRLEEFLTSRESPYSIDQNSPLYRLLEKGRKSDAPFDIKNAPLSLFIHKNSDPHKLDFFLEKAKEMFRKEIGVQDFLDQLPPALLCSIAHASAEMVFSRKEPLLNFCSPTLPGG